MIIELPEDLGAELKAQANAHGVSAEGYARDLLARDLALEAQSSRVPFKTGRGLLAKYGPAPSAEEIDANRAEMFGTSAKTFDDSGGRRYPHGTLAFIRRRQIVRYRWNGY